MMRVNFVIIGIFLTIVMLLPGCSFTTRVVLNMGTPAVSSMNESFNRNCDIQLMKESMPFALNSISGLIDLSPRNTTFLVSGAQGYFGYAYAFVEDTEPERASAMYLKARDYGFRVIFGGKAGTIMDLPLADFEKHVKKIGKSKVPALFWSTIAWLSYIQLNLDRMHVYLEVPKAEAMARRLIELDETFYFGSPCLVMACYYAGQPEIAGGNPDLARDYFEKGISLSGGHFMVHHLFYARYYAVRIQDKALYLNLLRQIIDAPEDILPDYCAVTNVCKMKAKQFLDSVDEFF